MMTSLISLSGLSYFFVVNLTHVIQLIINNSHLSHLTNLINFVHLTVTNNCLVTLTISLTNEKFVTLTAIFTLAAIATNRSASVYILIDSSKASWMNF